MNINDLDQRDYKYIVQDTANFNPQRNKALVAETLTEYEKYVSDIQVEKDGNLMNRIDMLSSYAASKFHLGSSKKFREFVGEPLYKSLIGEKLLERIKMAQITNKLNNNQKYANCVVL